MYHPVLSYLVLLATFFTGGSASYFFHRLLSIGMNSVVSGLQVDEHAAEAVLTISLMLLFC